MRKTFLALAVLLSSFASAQSGPFVITSASSICASIGVGGPITTIGVDVEGTFSLTLTPEVALSGRPPANWQTTNQATTITAAGYYQVNVAGFSLFELCPTAYTSGTATIYLLPGNGPTSGGSSGVSSAVTQSGTWNVRLQDTAGNGLTSNSSTQSRSLDVNIVSLLGATHSGTNPLFARPTDGTNPVTACVSAYGTAPTGTFCESVNAFVTNNPFQPGTQVGVATTASSQSALTTAVVVKASAGNLYGFQVTNGAGSVCYLEFMNIASSPTLGTGATYSFAVPASGTLTITPTYALSNYATGISIGMATTYNGAVACGTAATAVIFYK